MVKSVEAQIDKRCILQPPTVCPYCHAGVKYTSHAEIYGGRVFSDWPFIYLCMNSACKASVGVHAGTAHPLGTLADQKTKDARKEAHAAFDPLWKSEKMKRGEAYKWLADKLDIDRYRCHISWFDVAYCKKVVEAVQSREEFPF